NLLDSNEVWLFTSTGVVSSTAAAGFYGNTATVRGTDANGNSLLGQDAAYHSGFGSGTGSGSVKIESAINAANPFAPTAEEDADLAPGRMLPLGSSVTWTYLVTNQTGTPLTITSIADDFGTPGNTSDDFTPAFVSGDANTNGLLDANEVWLFTSGGVSTYQVLGGQYRNLASVSAMTAEGALSFDDDAAFHFGTTAGIRVQKAINAANPFAPTAIELSEPAPGRALAVGSSVVWTYQIFNDGDAPVSITTIRDDAGTPANAADDFTPKSVHQPASTFNIGDLDRDTLLDPTEVWLYTSAGAYTGTTTAVNWNQVFQDVIQVTNTTTTGTGFTVDPVNQFGDDIFTGGKSKDVDGVTSWSWKQHTPQDKDDIAHAFGSSVADSSSGHQLLFAGLDRFAANGDATVGFWFFQKAVSKSSNGSFGGMHTDGDILLTVNFTQGGQINSVTGFRWTGSEAGGSLTALNAPAGALFADVNTAPVSVPWTFKDKWGNTSPQAGELIRAGIDLTAIYGANVPTFASFLTETRSSQVTNSTLSDFALGTMGKVTTTTSYKVKPGQYSNVVTVAATEQGTNLTLTASDVNFHFGVEESTSEIRTYNSAVGALDSRTRVAASREISAAGASAGTGVLNQTFAPAVSRLPIALNDLAPIAGTAFEPHSTGFRDVKQLIASFGQASPAIPTTQPGTKLVTDFAEFDLDRALSQSYEIASQLPAPPETPPSAMKASLANYLKAMSASVL
ncbi:MAG TPA: hypothetical protein VF614_05930, partial [Chthoniobacteraceae bacterium]